VYLIVKSCKSCSSTKIQLLSKGRYATAQRCPACFGVCKKCDDLGYGFEKDHLGREVATPCECRDTLQKIAYYNAVKMPAQFFDAKFSNYDTKAHPSLVGALKAAKFLFRHYSKGDWRGILFMGGVGVGKTRLVCSLLREFALEHQISCLFQEFTSLLSTIKSQYDQGVSESGLLAQISDIDVLVIDELGKGRGTDWELGILDNLISSRYAQKKTTLFTTNYTDSHTTTYQGPMDPNNNKLKPLTLEERVGQRIYSRLNEMCSFVHLDGPDRRMFENQN